MGGKRDGYNTESSDEEEDEDNHASASPRAGVSPILELTIGEDGATSSSAGGGGMSFTGRCFIHLQALLNHYCPVIEGWLRTVADIILPEMSPSLTDFLWEPLGRLSGGGGKGNAARTLVEKDCEEMTGSAPLDKDSSKELATLYSLLPKPPKSPTGGKNRRANLRSSSSHSLFFY